MIKQVLQQGINAHKEGKFKDAERLYREILQSQPAHPDANHNLGLIAVSMNEVEVALPLFINALEANPGIEQLWLSYIDALIKAKRLEDAKKTIKKAKKKGFDAKKLDELLYELKGIGDAKVPSQQQLISLFELYQNKQFNEAENIALQMTKEFPKHQLCWKVLGAV